MESSGSSTVSCLSQCSFIISVHTITALDWTSCQHQSTLRSSPDIQMCSCDGHLRMPGVAHNTMWRRVTQLRRSCHSHWSLFVPPAWQLCCVLTPQHTGRRWSTYQSKTANRKQQWPKLNDTTFFTFEWYWTALHLTTKTGKTGRIYERSTVLINITK